MRGLHGGMAPCITLILLSLSLSLSHVCCNTHSVRAACAPLPHVLLPRPSLQVCGDRLLTSHDPAEARLLDGEIVLGWARQALAAIETAAVAALKSEPQFQAGR